MTEEPLDLLVLGSGVAGLSAAVRAASRFGLRTGVLTKSRLDQATTRWAQGGVAAALSGNPEELDEHFADTLAAGAGLCDTEAVRVLVDEGPRRVEELIALGAEFDRDERGDLELAREGGHSVARVVHAGGAATGAEIERTLVDAVRLTAASLHEDTFALDLVVEDGRCAGVVAAGPDGRTHVVRAQHILLATGGAGQLFSVTTNPSVATGDGVAMALRAGVAVADLEFFQFHPTALALPGIPRPLLSEALRGHGALLRDRDGERFVDELLPRDVVSRAIHAKMLEQGTDHVWLDATVLEDFAERFPTINADLVRAGLDARTDLLPVAPAAHHQCGGIVTDLSGATTLPGLWAAGETACSGVHGANRLASNSLLEGMVFGPRAVEAIAEGIGGPEPSGAMRPLMGVADRIGAQPTVGTVAVPTGVTTGVDAAALRHDLQRAMFNLAGVQRTAEGLEDCAAVIDTAMAAAGAVSAQDPALAEVANLALVGRALVVAAVERTESRGTHSRLDHPGTDPDMAYRLVARATLAT